MAEPLPGWVQALRRFGNLVRTRGLRNAIVGFVVGAILSALTDAATFAIGQIQAAAAAVAAAFEVPFDALGDAFGPAGAAVIDTLAAVNDTLFTIVEPAGLFAPIIVIAIWAGVVLVAIRLARAAVGEIPIVGGIAEFLGVSL